MFRSLASSIITLVAVLLFAFTMLFVFSGSAGVKFQRNALVGDVPTATVVKDYLAEQKAKAEPVDNGFTREMTDEPADTEPEGGGDRVVLWVSLPGFRTDYVDKAEAPFLQQMVSEGASTDKMKPNFPCLTAPAHATLATGTTVDTHGIPMDKFRIEDGSVVEADGPHLTAEPIWTTATRQGVRVLVHDWPTSFTQPAENAAAYSNASYNKDSTDQERLDALYKAWSEDKDENKLRLVMCKLDGINTGAQVNGPRTDEAYAEVGKTDKVLKGFIDKVKENWATLAKPNAELVVLVTTDHGMVATEKNINLGKLLGPDMLKNIDFVAHDAIGQLYFKDLPDSAGEVKLFEDKFDNAVSKMINFRTFRPEDVLANWKFTIPGRTGDRILVLKSGFAFTDFEAEEPVFIPSEGSNLFGCYGFPAEDALRMAGRCIIWGYPNQPSTRDMGEIDQTVFHASVCKLLGIEPSEKASTTMISVD